LLGLNRYVSQQILYSLLYRQAEHELLPAALDQGVGSLIYSPLAQGYLTGKFSRDGAGGRLVDSGQLLGADTDRARAIVETLAAIAAEGTASRTSGQLALGWLLGRPGVTSLIVGARNADQFADSLAAAEIALSGEERERLEAASATAPFYPQTAQRVFHRERNPRPL
jgi:aryl-alcohol dehydrogenase-like predicted oxidoreductase